MQEPFSSIEDFIFNASFRSWLLDNNDVHKEYWENWIAENPTPAKRQVDRDRFEYYLNRRGTSDVIGRKDHAPKVEGQPASL